MRRIGVFTSGGDAPGMNAALRAVVRASHWQGIEVVGILRGYAGMIQGEFRSLGPRDMANTIQRGGTILLTARSKIFMTEEGRAAAAGKLRDIGIEGLVAVGGDGTFRGAARLTYEHNIPVVGIPGTIDNDIFGTDYTIGFDTAVNTALDAIDRVRDTAASHERVFFIEVMGRHAGFIALEVAIAGGAEIVVVPEVEVVAEKIARRIKDSSSKGKTSSIVVVAEGACPGGGSALIAEVNQLLGFEGRLTILGHIQRGGSPTAKDRVLASRLGDAAVRALASGQSGAAVGEVNGKISFTPLMEAVERRKPIDMEQYRLIEMLAQ